MSLWMLLLGCWGANAYIVEGTVIEVREGQVVLDHEPIDGLMPAMVMPFDVADPSLLAELDRGDRVYARYEIAEEGGRLTKVRVTGQVNLPAEVAPAPLGQGEGLPPITLPSHRGAAVSLGLDQGTPTLLTFIYTRCPLPEACPAMVARLQAVDQALGDHPSAPPARIVAVSLDPDHDTPEVLAAYAAEQQLSERWHLVRPSHEVLEKLALAAGMNVLRGEGELDIVHGNRLLVLGPDGRLLARHDTVAFPLDAVISSLGASP